MSTAFHSELLKLTQAASCEETEVIQSLWSGYGKISRYALNGSALKSVVVKFISPASSNGHPRGWDTDYSHQRKVTSYKVETHWYKNWNHKCGNRSRVPKFIGSYSEDGKQWIILEDLNAFYPVRKHHINLSEVKGCLSWLANFHVTFLGHAPKGLWDVGTYWNLDTRPDEFKKIENQALKSNAGKIDDLLNSCEFQTIVHGDAKLANFCFSEDGRNIAAVDFQYVGGGCGMKDVAYFLGSCLSSDECERYEDELLDFYFSTMKSVLLESGKSVDFKGLEKEWRRMYPIACTDFIRFMMGWMPSHQKVNNYNLKLMNEVLEEISK